MQAILRLKLSAWHEANKSVVQSCQDLSEAAGIVGQVRRHPLYTTATFNTCRGHAIRIVEIREKTIPINSPDPQCLH